METIQETSNAKIDFENYQMTGKWLEVVQYPHPALKTKADSVENFDSEIESLCRNMLFTMYKSPGIGLAAPQIGISKRLFVMDVHFEREEVEKSNDESEYIYSGFKPQVYINPKVIKKEGSTTYEEGCLSLPGIFEEVKRADKISIEYQNIEGEKIKAELDGLESICFQHELDHLEGVVFIERLSPFKRSFYKKKLHKRK